MKKITVLFLTAILCLSVSVMTSFAAGNPDSPIFDIAYGTPEIDLELDACYLESTKVTFNSDMGDAGGFAYFAWDYDKLYFFVQVDDSTPCPKNAASVTNHQTDSIELITSLYTYSTDATEIASQVMSDIGDAHFRILRTNERVENSDLTSHGLDYNAHGGFGLYTWKNSSSYVLHNGGTDKGYAFEGYFEWSPELLESDKPIDEGSVIGLGLQINDDTNDDGTRDKKIYSINANPETSMTSNRATLGAFKLAAPVIVDEAVVSETVTVEVTPSTFDGGVSVLAVASLLSGLGIALIKKDNR